MTAREEKNRYFALTADAGLGSSTSHIHQWELPKSDGQELPHINHKQTLYEYAKVWLTRKSLWLIILVTTIFLALFSFFASVPPKTSLSGSRDIFTAPPSSVDMSLEITNRAIQPDGFPRMAVLAGGTFPGTPILATRGPEGTKFKINVLDSLIDPTMYRSTSIHWHGIFQRGTNWADGTAWVTQCPITPGHSFQYEFTVPSQVGTYWYHSHLSTQYCDGLRGAFVIYNPDDPYKDEYEIDDESTIITLSDWYHEPSSLFSKTRGLTANATLINGKGRAYKSQINTLESGSVSDLAIVNVQHGKRYRFRLIAMSCDDFFIFSIDNHNLTIIEADGEYTEKYTVDNITIFAGQRYSVILNADQRPDNYWIRADFQEHGFDGGINSAILHYEGVDLNEPRTNSSSVNPFREENLFAKFNPQAPGGECVGCVDKKYTLMQGFNEDLLYEMNGVSFVPPMLPVGPVLLQILRGVEDPRALFPKGSIYDLPRNSTVEITIPGMKKGGPHPYHLHGHSFSVIRSADSDIYNYKNPVRRDTVNTGVEGSQTTFRFVTDNAGPWFLHCHVDWHLELGLAVVFVEDIKHTKEENPVPCSWKQLCPDYERTKPEEPGSGLEWGC